MKINKKNYELYFTDYLDNKLNVNEIAELMIFLTNNPDLENELTEIKNIKLSNKNNIIFNKKSLLYKDTDTKEITNFENKCIAFIENDLSENEKTTLLNNINLDTDKQKTFEIFNNIKLTANKSIKFDNKELLRHNLKVSYKRKLFISYLSSAAAVLLFVFMFNFFKHEQQVNNYDKVNFSYLDNNIINNIKKMIENLNDNFIPDLY